MQLSDTHLSGRHGYFVANWAKVVATLNADPPDLVVISGDLSVNGSDDDDDLSFALTQCRRLRTTWRVVAGNHDIGEEPDALVLGQQIDASRVDRWSRLAGRHFWAVDAGPWRLVGINGFLYGSGLPDDEAQHEWLVRAIDRWDGPIGVFVHKPLFIDDPDEPEHAHHTFSAANRQRLLDVLVGSTVRFVASGHLHQSRDVMWNGIRLLWAPSTAFPAGEVLPGASPALGWIEHVLDGERHDATIVRRDDLAAIELASLKDGGRYDFLYQTPPRPPDPADLSDLAAHR